MATVLIAEDEPEIRDYLGLALRCEGYDVEFARDGEEVVQHLEHNSSNISLLLMDLIMPRKDGFETLKQVRGGWPGLPVITLSGSCTPANVATVLKGGAVDFLPKPIAHSELVRAVTTALNDRPAVYTPKPDRSNPSGAQTASWRETCDMLLATVGGSDVPVLLRGETGVGKEVLARKLHAQSRRAARPFLKLNCAALPSELVESELFGYERGAFTGAFKSTPGKFEMANGGTILLDEIGDMDFKLQAKLLQVLQDREFLRLGAKETQQVDVRVMAATHCDLERAIVDGRFREDLYYRLNIIEIHVPPMRERKDEIVSLAHTFLHRYAPGEFIEIPASLEAALLEHDWPGNVRELENVIRKFLVMRNPNLVAAELRRRAQAATSVTRKAAVAPTPADIPAPEPPATESRTSAAVRAQASEPSSTLADVDSHRRRAEKEAILSALQTSLWNRKKAAALLQIDYKALLYKMKKLGIGDGSVN
ncbi:MAG TPA: sigma-54 dependent transcriptional regulator [Bryobacteraceae bacterium]|jgi:two-component system response regulator AtoC|nr:sigma-54 dependent transcriptional regulator [Bryobacteraceae bacterium]